MSTGETIIYSRHEDSNAPHTQGVAVMMSEKSFKVAYKMGASECKANGCQVQNIS